MSVPAPQFHSSPHLLTPGDGGASSKPSASPGLYWEGPSSLLTLAPLLPPSPQPASACGHGQEGKGVWPSSPSLWTSLMSLML